jgi:hypothetical protein
MGRVAIDLGNAVEPPAPPLPELSVVDSDFVDFATAGSNVAGEYRCADCGYGAVVQKTLPPCPMCRGTVWERREPRAARFLY